MNLKLAFFFWVVMVVIAILNGYFGEFVVARLTGGYIAHLYKTFFIITVIFIFSRNYLKRVSVKGGGGLWLPALSAGFLWLFCSIIFEFIAGHYVFRFPWEKLLADYRIHEGRLWSLVLATEVLAPLINAYLIN